MTQKKPSPIAELARLTGVPKTLCIPLWGRAHSSELLPKLAFTDEKAKEWCNAIAVDPTWLEGDSLVLKSCVARAKRIDDFTREFIDEAKGSPSMILCVGAGLCSRMDRLGLTQAIQNAESSFHWVDLDLPEVIELRKKLRPPIGHHL